MTAGRDSVRMYRLKAGALRGVSVRMAQPERRVTSFAGGLSAALGPNIFTDIAFEAGVGVYGAEAWKMYVSSASGALFQVDYHRRLLTCVYQLHSAPINSIQASRGWWWWWEIAWAKGYSDSSACVCRGTAACACRG